MWRKIQSYQLLMERQWPWATAPWRSIWRCSNVLRQSLFGSLYSADFHRGFMETFMAISKNLSMALTCLFGHSFFLVEDKKKKLSTLLKNHSKCLILCFSGFVCLFEFSWTFWGHLETLWLHGT